MNWFVPSAPSKCKSHWYFARNMHPKPHQKTLHLYVKESLPRYVVQKHEGTKCGLLFTFFIVLSRCITFFHIWRSNRWSHQCMTIAGIWIATCKVSSTNFIRKFDCENTLKINVAQSIDSKFANMKNLNRILYLPASINGCGISVLKNQI